VLGSIDSDSPAGELLRESGGPLLVEPESPRSLAEAMLRLSNDLALRRKLGHSARKFAERRLGKDAAMSRFETSAIL